ncbi:MAG: ribulose-phosphate 3-epimerase [Christensenella sp.]|nr:ribulose-phosphate 3-epimerase [Christensenella sp.]
MKQVSASILSANWLRLGEELKRAEEAGCDCIHVDITDGHFVSNLTMGMDITRAVCNFTGLRTDVHLMIEEPGRFIAAFADTGADSITFHAEATAHPFELIREIKKHGKLAGVALDPATPVEAIEHYLDQVDLVLLVAVCVGFGGQKFIDAVDEKIKRLAKMREDKDLHFEIQVDGGINTANGAQKRALGVDNLVGGSMIFLSEDIKETVRQLKA